MPELQAPTESSGGAAAPLGVALIDRFRAVRRFTERLCEPLCTPCRQWSNRSLLQACLDERAR